MNTILIDGLWQGGLVAAIAVLATSFIPQGHAATRYAVWYCALNALVVLPVLTQWHRSPALGTLPAPVAHAAVATALATNNAATLSGNWLVIAWLCGVTIGLVRLARSYAGIRRILRDATPAPELGPDVVISEEIGIPIAAGVRRPAIVLPANLAATLDAGDLDRIIQHERAHIRRGDVLGNIVQRAIEAVLFFNPWVYLIGRQLVKEREAACDDWAVHSTGEPDLYASCLARLAHGERLRRTPLLTPSAIGSGRMLVGRIARLLNGRTTELKVNYLVLGANIALLSGLAILLQTSNGLASVSTLVASNQSFPPNCYHDVKPIDAAEPDISKADYRAHVSANAVVTVNSQGHPVSAQIVKSSGSMAIDRATINAAMHSTYSPEVFDCKPKTGQYLFHVETGPS